MDCRQYQDALNAAALGAESGADAEAFGLHLKICEACRRELARRRDFLGLLDHELETQFEAAPSPDFNARLRRRIAAEGETAARPFLYWWPALAGAAAFLVALALFHSHSATPPLRVANPVESTSSAEAAPTKPDTWKPNSAPRLAISTAEAPSRTMPSLHAVALRQPATLALKVRIDRREFYATVRFTQAVAEGRINVRPLLSAAEEAEESGDAQPLQIPVLEAPSLTRPSTDENDTARADTDAPTH